MAFELTPTALRRLGHQEAGRKRVTRLLGALQPRLGEHTLSLLQFPLVDLVPLPKGLFTDDLNRPVEIPSDLVEHFKDSFVRILVIETLEEFDEFHFVAVGYLLSFFV